MPPPPTIVRYSYESPRSMTPAVLDMTIAAVSQAVRQAQAAESAGQNEIVRMRLDLTVSIHDVGRYTNEVQHLTAAALALETYLKALKDQRQANEAAAQATTGDN